MDTTTADPGTTAPRTRAALRFAWREPSRRAQRATAWPLLAAAVFAAVWLILPVFGGGPLLNQDHPIHFMRLWGFLAGDQPALVPYWNPYMNAGRPYFHAYPVLFYGVARVVAWLVEPALAYKLTIALVHLVPALSLLVLGRTLRRPLAGAYGACLILVAPGSPQSAGYGQLINAGVAPSSLATGLLPMALAAALHLLARPDHRRLAVAAIAAAALLLAHVVSFSFFALVLIVAAALHLPSPGSRRLELLWFPVLTASLAAHWLLPVVWRRLEGHFISAFGAATVARSHYSPTLFHKYFWDPLSRPLLAVAVGGLVVALLRPGAGSRARRTLAVAALLVPVLWLLAVYAPEVYQHVPIDRVLQLQRAAADLYVLLVALAGLALAELARLRVVRAGRPIAVGLLAATALTLTLGVSLAARTARLRSQVVTLDPAMAERHRAFYGLLARRDGRVMHQETLFQLPFPLGATHLEALMPTYHGGESFSFDSFGFQEDLGFYDLGDILRQLPDADRQRWLFERYNVRWVITVTDEVAGMLRGTRRLGTVAPWTLHATGIEPSMFAVAGGTLLDSTYHGTEATAHVRLERPGRVLFKVHDYPNWRLTADGGPAERVNDRGSLIEVALPPGEHDIELRYRLTPLDIIAYLVSGVGLILAGWLLLGRREPALPAPDSD